MIVDALEFLINQYKPVVKDDSSETLYVSSEYEKQLQPTPSPIKISSLGGIIDYISTVDEKISSPSFIHVESHCQVNVVDSLNVDMDRNIFAFAKCPHDRRRGKDWYDLESFIITIKSDFVQDENTDKLLNISSKIDLSDTASLKDDGISQEVSLKSGVHLVNKTEIPSLIKLRPYSTFTEIEQPACDFVYRVRKKEHSVQIGLFECENANWQVQAVNDIYNYLKDKVNIPVVR